MAKSVKDQIHAILEEYIEEKSDQIEQITKEVAQETVKELKSTSPKSDRAGKHYRSGWRVKNASTKGVRRSIKAVVYNATKPQLTHLLAKPHDIKNQYGFYGRSKPDPHLEDAEKNGNDLYLHRLDPVHQPAEAGASV